MSVPAHVPDGGSFTVDLARAPQVLRDLEDARDQLEEIRVEAFRLGRIDPGSADEVSRDAAAALGAVAVGGAGSLIHAVDGGVARIDQLLGVIRAELAAYERAEQEQHAAFDERS